MPSRPWSSESSRAIPPYDAMEDEHCQDFCASARFQSHWGGMNRALCTERSYVGRGIAQKMAAAPRLLPFVAQHPIDVLQANLPREKNWSEEEVFERILSSAPRNPLTWGRRTTSHHVAPPSTARNASQRHRPHQPLPSAAKPRHRGHRRLSVNDLTLTYITALSRQEDYTRRALDSERCAVARRLAEIGGSLRERIEATRILFSDINDDERRARSDIDLSAAAEFNLLTEREQHDRDTARLNEEIFPLSQQLYRNDKGVVEGARRSAIAVEVRWQGGVELDFVVMHYDTNGRFLGLATFGENLRDSSGTTLIRSWRDHSFDANMVQRCSRRSMEMMLESISPGPERPLRRSASRSGAALAQQREGPRPTTSGSQLKRRRFVFAVMNESKAGGALNDLRRAYLTVRVPLQAADRLSSSTPMKEMWAIPLPESGTYTAIAVASIELEDINGVEEWVLQCHNATFEDIASFRRLSSALSQSVIFATQSKIEDAYLQGRQRLLRLDVEFYEQLLRNALTCCQQVASERLMEEMGSSRAALEAQVKLQRRKSWRRLLPSGRK